MASNKRDVQQAQLDLKKHELETHVAALAARGVTEPKRDRVVRHLTADIKALRKRLIALDAVDTRSAAQAERKAVKAATPRVAKRKSKKAAAPAPEQSKKKEKKEKKKDKESAPKEE
jgi:hypothetical protein